MSISGENLLAGKRILVVDDEPDVVEILKNLLDMCEVVTASSFDAAKNLLESQSFDFAILDIMGVRGFELLPIANKRKIPAVMLTAHAMDIDNTVKSFKEGAALFVPKDEMNNIALFLSDVVEAQKKGKSSWWRWLERFTSHYESRFGPNWKKGDKEFWAKFPHYY